MTASSATPPLRVVVVDDQLLVRAGVSALLNALPGCACVGTADGADAALQTCQDLQPDLVLLDLHLPPPQQPHPQPLPLPLPPLPAQAPAGATPALERLQGLLLARALRAEHPRLRQLVLSGYTAPEVVRAALRAGVDGFIAKDFVLDELAHALQAVRLGQRWLSPRLQAALQAAEQARSPGLAAGDADMARLTPRQRDVLSALARGQSNKQIARSLGISVKTVEYHRTELIQRLDLHDVASLTRYAITHGLVS